MGASACTASHPKPPLWQKAKSASSRLQGSWAFMAPSFIVLERGSNTARMRAAPTRRRSPLTVVRMAVGWCAKSSYTVTAGACGWLAQWIWAVHSMRRLTFSKRASAAADWAGVTPTCSAAAIAAKALSWLCTPLKAHCTRATGAPCCCTVNCSGGPRATKSLTAAPKLRTSLQHPACSTRARLSSKPLTTTRPRGGTVRSRWLNWRSMAARSSKMSAWSNSRLLSTAVRGR